MIPESFVSVSQSRVWFTAKNGHRKGDGVMASSHANPAFFPRDLQAREKSTALYSTVSFRTPKFMIF
nr:hypothetical protein CFP56_25737 [Quercus suber]